MRETRQLLTRGEMEMSGNQRIMSVTTRELDSFLSVLSQEGIALLMEKDKCFNYVDNYLLATVLVYFKRANLSLEEFSPMNFWRCLYLAHDMEEDDERLKWELLPWALGQNWKNSMTHFLQSKDKLWARMKYRWVQLPAVRRQLTNNFLPPGLWCPRGSAGRS